jgi:hypothetical protein
VAIEETLRKWGGDAEANRLLMPTSGRANTDSWGTDFGRKVFDWRGGG